MVVVLVIAILLAIAVPTFLGARERSQDRAAQSNLRNALTAAKVLFVDTGDYRGATTTGLGNIEPGLTWQAATVASAEEFQISVSLTDSDTIFAAASMSDSETCFQIKDDSNEAGASGGTKYGTTTGACTGTAAATGAAAIDGWRTD